MNQRLASELVKARTLGIGAPDRHRPRLPIDVRRLKRDPFLGALPGRTDEASRVAPLAQLDRDPLEFLEILEGLTAARTTLNHYIVLRNISLAFPILAAAGVGHLLCDASKAADPFDGERLVFQHGNHLYQWNGDFLVNTLPRLPPGHARRAQAS